MFANRSHTKKLLTPEQTYPYHATSRVLVIDGDKPQE